MKFKLFSKIPQPLFPEIRLQKFVTRGLCQKNKIRVIFTSFNAEKCHLSCNKYKIFSLRIYSYIFWSPNVGSVRIWGRSNKIWDLHICLSGQVILLKDTSRELSLLSRLNLYVSLQLQYATCGSITYSSILINFH